MNQQIIVNNQLISYLSVGDKNVNHSLVFLHGWRSNKEVWGPIVNKLVSGSANQLRMYSIDLPGFGQSPAPKGEWGAGDYAKLVKDFIEKLELKNVTIVGHSFGGRVGIWLAANYASAISKLVLVDSAGFVMNQSKRSIMSAAAKVAKPFFKASFMQPLRKKIYKKIGAEDYLATPELQKTFVNVVSEDLTEEMKKIKIPTLIVFGENDEDTPPEFGKRMHGLLLNSYFLILKGAGHFSFLDKPEEFQKELMSFIK